jgi:hypothetical protein
MTRTYTPNPNLVFHFEYPKYMAWRMMKREEKNNFRTDEWNLQLNYPSISGTKSLYRRRPEGSSKIVKLNNAVTFIFCYSGLTTPFASLVTPTFQQPATIHIPEVNAQRLNDGDQGQVCAGASAKYSVYVRSINLAKSNIWGSNYPINGNSSSFEVENQRKLQSLAIYQYCAIMGVRKVWKRWYADRLRGSCSGRWYHYHCLEKEKK